jgi:CAAX protease family protein
MNQDVSFEPGSATDPFFRPAPIPAFVRFLLAALWTAGVFWASGFVYLLFPGRNLVPGLIYRILACALTAAGFLFFLRVLDFNTSPWPRALRIPLDRTGLRQCVTGLALGAMLMSADVAAIAAFGSLQFRLHLGPHMAVRAAGAFILLIFGAMLEELSFRGYPFEKLIESCGAFCAVMLLSALFGALHLGNPEAGGWLSWGFFNTLAVGVIFALARLRSGSLWLSFGLHFSWNLFQGVVFGLPVSGLREFTTIVSASAHGPLWLTGGAYGPEASATCSVVLIVALPLVWVLTADRKIQHRPSSSPSI